MRIAGSGPELSCAFAPGPQTVAHVALAESLGYRRAWLYDSPALYADVWATLARAADATERIGLATGVTAPRLRHPIVTASAVATIERLAPDRFALGVGTGFTSAHTLGLRPMRWSEVVDWVRALRALLRGEAIEWEGRKLQLMYDPAHMPAGSIEPEVYFGAEGPKGIAAAREHADGVLTIRTDPGPFERSVRLVSGTVLDDGESPASERVWHAAGHAAATRYHLAYELGTDVSVLPDGEAWRASIDALDPDERHVVLHRGHVTSVSDHDARFLPREAVAPLTFTGTVDQLAARCERLAAKRITEIAYQPAGPDIPRELRAFARLATRSRQRG